jgi:hypothetical protein
VVVMMLGGFVPRGFMSVMVDRARMRGLGARSLDANERSLSRRCQGGCCPKRAGQQAHYEQKKNPLHRILVDFLFQLNNRLPVLIVVFPRKLQ